MKTNTDAVAVPVAQEAEQMASAQAGLSDGDLHGAPRKPWVADDESGPSEVEQVIACLGDDAVKLEDENPDDEMAQTMRDAARLLERLMPSANSSESVDTVEFRERFKYMLPDEYAQLVADITSLIAARVAGVRKDALGELEDHLAAACVKCGIPDSAYQSLCIALQSPASSSQENA